MLELNTVSALFCRVYCTNRKEKVIKRWSFRVPQTQPAYKHPAFKHPFYFSCYAEHYFGSTKYAELRLDLARTERVVVWTDQSLSHLRCCVCESPCCRHTCTHKEAVLPSHSHQGTCCPVAELPLQSNKSRSRRELTRTLMMQRSTAAASYSQTLSLTDMSPWQSR